MIIRVQQAAFDLAHELTSFRQSIDGAGALVSFTGIVRDLADDRLVAMEIEHYPGMTEKALQEMAETARNRFELDNVLVIHRYGRLHAAEDIMMVATAARHRKAAFQGADFLMDYLKSRAPFWKKEHTSAGGDWVKSKQDDEDALNAWKD